MLSAPLTKTYATAGDYTPITAISGKRIVVVAAFLTSSAAVTYTFKSSTTAITGALYTAANGTLNMTAIPGQTAQDERFIFKANTGEDLVITASGAATIGGYILYRFEAV